MSESNDSTRYSAVTTDRQGVHIVSLTDAETHTTVSVVPSVGNIAFELIVNGKNAFYFPSTSLSAYAEQPRLAGNPILWPWANRLDQDGFYFADEFHALDPERGNFGRDGNDLPIHGLVQFSAAWEVVEATADADAAWVTSRLDFAKHEDLSAQFPFPHVIEMTYRLARGELTVLTRIENQGDKEMPVSLGYHPYFQLHDAPRDEWTLSLPVDAIWNLSDKLTPTGETTPVTETFPDPAAIQLEGVALDHVFGDLKRNADDFAVFSATGAEEKIEVWYGPGYDTAVVYAPPGGRNFFCFEPMVGITNAFNLAHAGKFDALQTLPAGEERTYEYRVRVSGF